MESLDFICGAWWWEVPELVTKVEAVCVKCMHTISTCIYQLCKQNRLKQPESRCGARDLRPTSHLHFGGIAIGSIARVA